MKKIILLVVLLISFSAFAKSEKQNNFGVYIDAVNIIGFNVLGAYGARGGFQIGFNENIGIGIDVMGHFYVAPQTPNIVSTIIGTENFSFINIKLSVDYLCNSGFNGLYTSLIPFYENTVYTDSFSRNVFGFMVGIGYNYIISHFYLGIFAHCGASFALSNDSVPVSLAYDGGLKVGFTW